jgi:hypothetical protein
MLTRLALPDHATNCRTREEYLIGLEFPLPLPRGGPREMPAYKAVRCWSYCTLEK